MRAMMIVVAVALAGCGGDPSIDGTWSAPVNDGCGFGITFDTGAKTYVVQLLCQTGPNKFGSDLEGGDADFSVAGKVTMTPRAVSCPSYEHKAWWCGTSFSGERLILAMPEGAVSLDRVKGDVGSATAVQFGCWDMGTFKPHAIQDL